MAGDPMSREMLERLARAAKGYQEAFERVERLLAQSSNTTLPRWVFNLAPMNLDALRSASPEVARAEQSRRAARAALHAVAELLTLENPSNALAEDAVLGDRAHATAAEMSEFVGSLPTEEKDPAWLQRLDRFVSVVNAADLQGAQYINGTFEPLEFHNETDFDEITQVRSRV